MLVVNGITRSRFKTSVALGYFDGLHLGHRAVITAAVRGAGWRLTPTVFTFTQTPEVKIGEEGAVNILTPEMKSRLLTSMKVKQLYEVLFRDVVAMHPEQFVRAVLVDALQAKKVYCGFNYHFGRRGEAGVPELTDLCKKYDIEVHELDAVLYGKEPISSTRIKNCVLNGDMRSAAAMLGRPFSYDFSVVQGNQLGRTMGTPTINQIFPKEFLIPKFGVYASMATIQKKRYCGVTNIGVKPTVGSEVPLSETWMPDYQGEELYGQDIEVELIEFIREEKKFDSMEDLRKQILDAAECSKKIVTPILNHK